MGGAPRGDKEFVLAKQHIICRRRARARATIMAEELSAYELSRAERIKKNNAFLMTLGLTADVDALRQMTKPEKKKPKPRPKPVAPSGPGRRSRHALTVVGRRSCSGGRRTG